MMTLIRIGLAIAAVIGGGVLVNAALNPPVTSSSPPWSDWSAANHNASCR
ncbi:MAG: hypothetical protein NTW51_10830 [Cyanobacteria bacterium]|nr:hypothetical protein [Cyanobacteriota bacterium]